MSLGFNPNRPMRTTNLPGAVGNSVVSLPPRLRAPARRTSPMKSANLVARVEPSLPPQPMIPEQLGQEESSFMRGVHEEAQWVYADCLRPLQDASTGDEVAPEGSRVMLVYPMHTDEVTGRVRMRLKTVHAGTGQLSYRWVKVYDPEQEHSRPVGNFSLVS